MKRFLDSDDTDGQYQQKKRKIENVLERKYESINPEMDILIDKMSRVSVYKCEGKLRKRQIAQYCVEIKINEEKSITFVYDEMIKTGVYRYYSYPEIKNLWIEEWNHIN